MIKKFRISLAAILIGIGVIFFILPGSILFLIAGLMLLSKDVPQARRWLRASQKSMSRGAKALDKFLLNRKLRKQH